MPPAPQDPQGDKSSPIGQAQPQEALDPKSLLLPKKEAPGTTIDSAQRTPAGILLGQEQKAAAEGFADKPEAKPEAPAAPKAPDDSVVKPLETYQGDIEGAMQGGKVSVVSIAAAEAERRSKAGMASVEAMRPSWKERLKSYSMVAIGALLVAVAGGTLAYFVLRSSTVNVSQAPLSPFIFVDQTDAVVIPQGTARDMITTLRNAKAGVSLSLGLIDRIVPEAASTTADGSNIAVPMSAQGFLTALVPDIPDTLVRTLNPSFLFGVHVYDANQPFLIFSTDSYQEAFSGMLAWELHMKTDLSPLFDYSPSPHIQTAPPQSYGTSTLAATSSSGLQSLSGSFVDRIVENRDTRVLQNDSGDIVLLWTFIDRNTLVITTNAATLREIISRVEQAPTVGVPTQ